MTAVTDNPNTSVSGFSVTDNANRSPTSFVRLNWRGHPTAIAESLLENIEPLLALLEAQHHQRQAESVANWRERVDDPESQAIVALFGGPEKVLTPKPWTFVFRLRDFRHLHICWMCGTEYRSGSPNTRLCSEACVRLNRIRNSSLWRSRPKPKRKMSCIHCGETFTAKRSDSKYCSGKCRVAAYRRSL